MAINTRPTDNAEFEEIARLLDIRATPEQIARSSAYQMAEWRIKQRIPDAESATGDRETQIKLALRFLAASEIIQKDKTLMNTVDPGEHQATGQVRSVQRTQGDDSESTTYETSKVLSVSELATVFEQNAENILDVLDPADADSDGLVAGSLTESKLSSPEAERRSIYGGLFR